MDELPDTLTEDGDPTDAFLDWLKARPIVSDPRIPLEAMLRAWRFDNYAAETRPNLFVFATGGWSGNEAIIEAFRLSELWYVLAWQSIRVPGGLYLIALSNEAAPEHPLEEMFDHIRDWAWNRIPATV